MTTRRKLRQMAAFAEREMHETATRYGDDHYQVLWCYCRLLSKLMIIKARLGEPFPFRQITTNTTRIRECVATEDDDGLAIALFDDIEESRLQTDLLKLPRRDNENA
jgi:hypothetical protein